MPSPELVWGRARNGGLWELWAAVEEPARGLH